MAQQPDRVLVGRLQRERLLELLPGVGKLAGAKQRQRGRVADARPIGFELDRRRGGFGRALSAQVLSLVCTYIAHCASARPACAIANFGSAAIGVARIP